MKKTLQLLLIILIPIALILLLNHYKNGGCSYIFGKKEKKNKK
ncbi:MAG: hypothetical protein RBQ94_04250 [Methanimicrococcus sp.]|nr:hypothetical protein [Methanimicrococcus sp.]